MADPSQFPNFREPAGIPRWVKVVGTVVAVVVLLAVALLLTGGGGHRPRRHGGAGGDPPPPTATATQGALVGVPGDGGHTGPPQGGHR